MKKQPPKKLFKNLAFPIEDSAILRYSFRFPKMQSFFKKTSIKEGSRIFKLLLYKDVEIFIKDETTLMHTGTYKTLDACVSIAFCKKLGFKKIAFSSGANLGSAISEYAKKQGIETFSFHPTSTIEKLNPLFFNNKNSHVISVTKHEKAIKKLTKEFAQTYNIPLIPPLKWRFVASAFRALEIAEYSETNNKFDWIAQIVCAAYGPIGIYKEFEKLAKKYTFRAPKYLGLQQHANCPMVNAWQENQNHLCPRHINAKPAKYIEKALYNTNPAKSYPLLFDLLKKHGGNMLSVDLSDYTKATKFKKKLSKHKINFTTKTLDRRKEIVEKSGLLTLGGTLKAIDKGVVKKGESVLCLLTGGCGPFTEKTLIPANVIKKEKIKDAVKLLGTDFGLN